MNTRTLAELAELCGAAVDGDGSRVVDGPASLSEAGSREVAFYAQERYRADLLATRAAGVLVERDLPRPREDLTLLRCADPNAAFTRIVRSFVPPERPPEPGVHPTAFVDPRAEVAADAAVGPLCVVAAGARIGERAVLVAQVHVGEGARVGAGTVLHPGVVLYAGVEVGARCLIHSGAVLGADGFGFDPPRSRGGAWEKVPQCGRVVVEDEVEIGANTTIDRARFGATRVGRGAKLDNLVHLAHNVVVGPGALLVAQVGVAGSTRIGAGAILGGQAGINGHIEIGAGARIGAQSGVFGDVPPGVDWLGHPARPRREALRAIAAAHRVPDLLERIGGLERRLAELEQGGASSRPEEDR